MSARTGWLALLLLPAALLPARALTAQTLGPAREILAGAEARSISFARLPNVKRIRQLSFPVGVVLPFGRFRVDLSSAFVSTELERVDSSEHRVSHLTDTQLRGAYVFGRDALVATVVLNLPTGPKSATTLDYATIGATSPLLLGFPVPAYANGFSATAGAAAALPAGDWSFGLAGSVRVSSRFTPYADSSGPIAYKSGVEGRIRAGADGVLGSSRLSAGLTYSTFGDDQFGTTGTVRGQYRPGPRWLAEAALLAPLGSSSLSLAVWNFHRTAGDTTGVSTRNRENLASAELSFTIPLGQSLSFEPAVSGRLSKPEAGRGRLGGAGAGFRVRLSDTVALVPTARYDTGWVEDEQGARSHLHGGYASLFLRATF